MVMLTILTNALFHPAKFEILKLLKEEKAIDKKSSLSYMEIANKIGEDPHAITFHLVDLEKYGLVKGVFKFVENVTENETVRISKAYYINEEKLKETINEALKMLKQLSDDIKQLGDDEK